MKAIKSILTFAAVLFTAGILAIGSCCFYAFKIEPYRIERKEYFLKEKEEEMPGIKVLQFSDVHIKEGFTGENLEAVVEKINEQNPDVILFTGDLYDNYSVYHEDETVITQLSDLHASYAKLAVWGNRDYGGGAARQYESVMEQSGFTVLKNESRSIVLGNGKKLLITGLDDSLLGNPYLPESEKDSDSDYKILLTHEPDTAEEYLDSGYDLILSGHSHGGQIDIPFLPQVNETALAATKLASEYSRGMYDLSSERDVKLYVNTGIGTTHIPARFGVIPEIAVFYI